MLGSVRLPSLALVITLIAGRTECAARIAVFLPETGQYNGAAAVMRTAVAIGLDDAAKSGIAIKASFFDDRGLPDSSRAIARRLSTDKGVRVWLGGYPSDCARVMVEEAIRGGVPLIISVASADSLTMNGADNVFRIAPPSSDYTDGLFGWAASAIGADRRMVVVYDSSTEWLQAGAGMRRTLSERWRGEPTFLPVSPGQRDYGSTLAELRRSHPSVVALIMGSGDASRFLRRCRDDNWTPEAFLAGTASMASRKLISASDGAAEYLMAPAVWWAPPYPSPDSRLFLKRFQQRSGEPADYRAAETYAAMQVIADALRRAGENGTMQEALRQTDLQTVIGRVRFEDHNGFHNQSRVETIALQVINGEWRAVWPPSRAETKYVCPIPDWRSRGLRRSDEERQLLYLAAVAVAAVLMLAAVSARRKKLQEDMEKP